MFPLFMTFSFEITHKDGNARCGKIKTRRGEIETPYFVPVATNASIRSLDSSDLEAIGAQCFLANTYHLFLRPGLDVISEAGGVQQFMNYNKPMFSDSGGFQAFSLGFGKEHGIGKIGGFFPNEDQPGEAEAKLAHISEEGVKFKSIYDGTHLMLTPKLSMEIQAVLGSEIIMAFDECTSAFHDYKYTKQSLERTHRWAKECLEYKDPEQALYGIIQGGTFEDLRKAGKEFTLSQPFEGIAIGGTMGKTKESMYGILDWICPLDDRPVHLLGIGDVDDVFEGVSRGIDTFDCVSPSRNARRGSLLITPEQGGCKENKFRINIDNARFKNDFNTLEIMGKKYSLAYLQHLFRLKQLTYYRLSTLHNITFMLKLMEEIRESIKNKTFKTLKQKWLGKP